MEIVSNEEAAWVRHQHRRETPNADDFRLRQAVLRVFPSQSVKWEPEVVDGGHSRFYRARAGSWLFDFGDWNSGGLNRRDKDRLQAKQDAAQRAGYDFALLKRGTVLELESQIRQALRRKRA